MILLDGSQFIQPGSNTIVGQLEPLLTVPIEIVDRIEVLKSNMSAIYGSNGANGVIAIYTKKGTDTAKVLNQDGKGTVSEKIRGFHATREFYSPDYEFVEPTHAKPDKRATLYWNPHLTPDDRGEITVSFYNSDDADHFQFDLQGVSEYGQPIKKLVSIGVEKDQP